MNHDDNNLIFAPHDQSIQFNNYQEAESPTRELYDVYCSKMAHYLTGLGALAIASSSSTMSTRPVTVTSAKPARIRRASTDPVDVTASTSAGMMSERISVMIVVKLHDHSRDPSDGHMIINYYVQIGVPDLAVPRARD
jgi:hypothetical protein